LAILLALASGYAMAKGGKKPKPPPTPVDTGVIYFEVGGAGWDVYEMQPDGSGKTELGVEGYPSLSYPSLALHGLERWFLEFREVADDAYPSTNPRYELFAVSESGTAYQLTDGETNDENGQRTEIIEPNSWDGMDHEPRSNPRWANDGSVADGKVSFLGGTWAWDSVNEEWYVKEHGIYALSIDPDDLVLGSNDPARPTCLPITLKLNPYTSRGLFTNTDHHSWSPDGSGIAYYRNNTADVGIWRADYDDANDEWTEVRLVSDGAAPEWSPEPQVDKILFVGANGIEVMATSGANRTSVIPKLKKLSQWYAGACWSPSATHIVYQLSWEKRWGGFDSDIYRAEADGDHKMSLTNDVETYVRLLAWQDD
jgi:hypothetical protein